jgi:hypothetical protein
VFPTIAGVWLMIVRGKSDASRINVKNGNIQNLDITALGSVKQRFQLGQSLGGRVRPCHGEFWEGVT